QAFLARHQEPDGRFSARNACSVCENGTPGGGDPRFDEGACALAMLAFIGAGFNANNRATHEDPVTHERVSYAAVVTKGLRWLASRDLGAMKGEHAAANHALVAGAFAVSYAGGDVACRAPACK